MLCPRCRKPAELTKDQYHCWDCSIWFEVKKDKNGISQMSMTACNEYMTDPNMDEVIAKLGDYPIEEQEEEKKKP